MFKKEKLNVKKDESEQVIGFDISREYWGDLYLLDEETSKMCCLGFYGLACGLTQRQILGKNFLSEIIEILRLHRQVDWLYESSYEKYGTIEKYLSSINDRIVPRYQSNDKIEKKIKEIFAENGIEVNFVA